MLASQERDWTLHPGLTWADELQAVGQTQAHVARAIGTSTKHLNQVLRGHALPSAGLTLRFAQHVGSNARLLWRLQADYVMDLAQGRQDLTHDQ